MLFVVQIFFFASHDILNAEFLIFLYVHFHVVQELYIYNYLKWEK